MRKLHRRRRGLTLVEIMIALLVLAIALFGILSAILNGMVTKELNRELNVARDNAMVMLDSIRARNVNQSLQAFLNDPDADGNGGSGTPQGEFIVPGLPNGRGRVTYSPTGTWPADNAPPYLIEINVRITWSSTRGVRDYETTTMVTR